MSKKILVADDEKDLRVLLKDIFKGQGYEVFFVKDGEEALKKWSELMPDLVVMDMNMPKVGGLKVLQEMKKVPEFKKIPVILLSAFTHDRTGDPGDLANFYIKKPFDQDDLLNKIKALLSEQGSGSADTVNPA